MKLFCATEGRKINIKQIYLVLRLYFFKEESWAVVRTYIRKGLQFTVINILVTTLNYIIIKVKLRFQRVIKLYFAQEHYNNFCNALLLHHVPPTKTQAANKKHHSLLGISTGKPANRL